MKKRITGILLALGIVFGTFVLATPANAALETELQAMIDMGVMQGYGPGDYRPGEQVSRGQFATFVARALKLPSGTGQFTDVPMSIPLADGIYKTAGVGIVSGYTDGTFRPNENITREQMAAMINRAMGYLKIEKHQATVEFADLNQISPSFRDAVSNNVYYNIIQGYHNEDGTFSFKPKENATRAQAAAFIYRLLKVKDNGVDNGGNPPEPPTSSLNFKIATIDANGQLVNKPAEYTTYAQAAAVMTMNPNEVIVQDSKVVKMNSGIVYTTKYTEMNQTNLNVIVSIASNSEMKYLDTDGTQVKVQVGDTTGYVNQANVTLMPTAMLQGRSYYEVKGGELYHDIFLPSTNKYVAYKYGVAPSFLQAGQRYYSWNGDTFLNTTGTTVGQAYQYFNVVSVRTTSNYTADELNAYVAANYPTSPLNGLGAAMKAAEKTYHVNALYILAKAANESTWGTSQVAKDKKNLFGLNVTDLHPENGNAFTSYEECINYFANKISTQYLNPSGSYYFGTNTGDKYRGINVKYASDPYSEQKVSGIMYRVDSALGKKDWMKYDIAEVTGLDANYSLRARPEANTNQAEYYMYPSNGYPMTILESVDNNAWYKIVSDIASHDFAYVSGDYVKVLPIAGK